MRYLNLYSNVHSGTIPNTISALTSLQYLWFNSNSLVSTIPSTISGLTSLKLLFLNSNSLVGTIPSTISAMTSLWFLLLFNNYLTLGGATSVPISTFSSYTLSGIIDLYDNCFVFDTTSPCLYRHVTATHCHSTGKHEVCCPNIRYIDIILFYDDYFLFMFLHTTVITLGSLPYCPFSILFAFL